MSVLYSWPAAAAVGRHLPKERLYGEAGVGSPLKQRFVVEVQRITWAYKIGQESVRLAGDETVSEIQVFEVDLKEATISDEVLAAIDKAIPSPIIFEAHRTLPSRQARLSGAHKRAGAKAVKLSAYFHGPWLDADSERRPLPVALHLPALYAALLGSLAPAPLRAGEPLPELVERVTATRKLERELASLERRMRTEPQFNRKVELRRQLRAKTAELEALVHEETRRDDEDATWRS